MNYVFYVNKYLVALTDARRYALVAELASVLIIISVLIALAIPQYKNYIFKAKKTEFYSQLFQTKTDIVVEYAVTGKWPSINRVRDGDEDSAFYSTSSDIRLNQLLSTQGNFALSYEIPGIKNIYTDAYRLVHVHELEPTLYWVCAYTEARKDEAVRIPNITEVPIELLPHSCNLKRSAL